MTNTTKLPPLLPEETLLRVLRIATFDGWSVLGIAGLLALVSAAGGDFWGAAVGLVIAAAGAIELHGAGLLRAGETRGMNWVVASQPYLLATILGYCALRLWNYDPTLLRQAMTSDMRASLARSGVTEERFLRLSYVAGNAVLALVTMIYQGGMTAYYLRRCAAVKAAVGGDERDAGYEGEGENFS